MKILSVSAIAIIVLLGGAAMAQEGTIVVHASQVSHRVSPYTTGACIEDVNHEIYGGIYSQMIFGESFEEPALSLLPEGFNVFGGTWSVKDGVLYAPKGQGPKLVPSVADVERGEVGVEIFFPDDVPGNAGLIVKLKEPGEGADAFDGYEISLMPHDQKLLLGRHVHDWKPLQEVPCAVPVGQWIPLVVKIDGPKIEVLVNGNSLLKYEDKERPLGAGRIALRPWQREAHYRNLWLKAGDGKQEFPFVVKEDPRLPGAVSGMWRPFANGSAKGRFALETQKTFNGAQDQRVEFVSGDGEIGIENQSLNRWGMCFRQGEPYEGYVWVRADAPTTFSVAMESTDGSRVYTESELKAASAEWQRLEFALTPDAADNSARFAIKLKTPGSLVIGHAFLQPGSWGRFKELPVRKDVVEGLQAQGLTILRYGGSMVNAPEYRWKKMAGPRDKRPPYAGTWYPYSSNGWGIVDFVDLCEAAGFECVPAFNIEETPEDMADFAEYMKGGPETEWGKKRVEAGHPEPYKLKYLQIGNEEGVDDHYLERFNLLAPAIWAVAPDITIVVGDFLYNDHIEDPFNFKGAPRIQSLAAHKAILELAKANGKPVWFDVHVGNHEPRQPDELGGGIIGLRDFISALGKLGTGADFKVCVFEENSNNHAVRRGLGHAHAINELQRLNHEMPIVCAANCLQPYKQNDNGWDQGMLFLTPSQVWGQPPYYVTQMMSRNYLPLCVKAEAESANNDLDVTARRSEDGSVLTLQVVNLESRRVRTNIRLDGFECKKPSARVFEMRGNIDDENTPDDPDNVASWERDWGHEINNGETTYVFPPFSFTILRFE